MKFSVVGANKESGDDVDLVLLAATQEAAEEEAHRRGVLVSAIRLLEDDKDAIALVDDEPPASSNGNGAGTKTGTVAGAAVSEGSVAGKSVAGKSMAGAGPGAGASSAGSMAGRSAGHITVNASSPSDTAHTGDGSSPVAAGLDMSKAAMEYHIVMNQALYLLETAVNKYIRDGWEPQGGLSIGMSNNAMQYFQALVRKKKT